MNVADTYGKEQSILTIWGIVVFFMITTFEGPLRLGLQAIHAPFLVYLRDAAMVVTMLDYLSRNARRHALPLLLIAGLFLIHAAIGLYCTGDYRQVAFGAKFLMACFYGAVIAPTLLRPTPLLLWFFAGILGSALLGLAINAIVGQMPWSGLTYYVGDVKVSATRLDLAAGAERMAGFSRSAASLATLVSFLSIYAVMVFRSIWFRWATFAIAMPALYLTNNKASMAAYLIVMLFYQFIGQYRPTLMKAFLGAAYLMMILTPVAFVGIRINMPNAETLSFYSFVDRVDHSWPEAWSLIFDHGLGLLGRGIGGIGTAQRAFAPDLFNAADNFFIYLTAYFGIFALVYIGYVITAVSRATFPSPRRDVDIAFIILALIGLAGVTSQVLEETTASVYLGAAIAMVVSAVPPRRFSE